MICMACRQATNMVYKAVKKPHRTVSDINPMMETCSVCRSPLKYLKLLVQDFAVTEIGQIHLRYSHRFYITDSANVMTEVMNTKKKGTVGRYCGICYDGKRTCTKMFTDIYPPPPKQRQSDGDNSTDRHLPPCTDVKFWFRCKECRKCDDDYGASFSLGLRFSEAQPTCLRRYFTDSTFEKKRLCRGCKIAASCSHLDIALYRLLKNDNLLTAIVKRVKRLAELRFWLLNYVSWTGRVISGHVNKAPV